MEKTLYKVSIALVLVMIIVSLNSFVLADDYAHPTKSKVIVNGTEVDFEAYNINGNNYFKLRDIAKVLTTTESKFNVKWDEGKKAINLITNAAYESVGGELEKSNIVTVKIKENKSPIYKDGNKIEMLAYNIGGNNYFKLRDMGNQLGFGVDYDEKTKNVLIHGGKGNIDIPKKAENSDSTKRPVFIEDLDEYKLKVEYSEKDIEYKYDLSSSGKVDAEIDDQVKNEKTKGDAAAEFIENKLLGLDYTGSNDEIIERMLNSLGIPKNYKKIKLEIEYNNKGKLEIEKER